MVKMLSFDTSTSASGVAYFIDGVYISSTVLMANKKDKGDVRLDWMIKEIYRVMRNAKPDIVVIEQEKIGNSKITVMLSQLIGAVRAYCVDNDISYWLLEPAQWRSAIGVQKPGITRDQFKPLVMEWVKNNITTKEMISDDQSDAIAIGYAYIKMFEGKQ